MSNRRRPQRHARIPVRRQVRALIQAAELPPNATAAQGVAARQAVREMSSRTLRSAQPDEAAELLTTLTWAVAVLASRLPADIARTCLEPLNGEVT